MNKLSAVLFDLDGTLIDTAPDFVRILNAQRARYQLPALAYETIRAVVSAGARAMVQTGFPDVPVESAEFDALRQEFLQAYSAELVVETRLFPGMESLLAELEARGIPWGIVTNKGRTYSAPLLRGLNLEQRCAVLVCPDDVSKTKPDPEPLLLACHQLGIEPSSAIYVGDHLRDIQAGKAAGMPTVAVGFGYIGADEDIRDWAADHLVHTVAELHTLLLP